MTHQVEGASHPNYIGTDQRRFFTWRDNLLVLSTSPERAGASKRALPPRPVPAIDPYDWAGVSVICGILGAEALALQLVLRPSTFNRSWARLGAALVLEVALLWWKSVTMLPRLGAPRYFYVPWAFSLAAVAGLLSLALVLAASSVKRETP